MKLNDQKFIMEIALLECAVQENIDSDTLTLWRGKSGTWYITSKEKDDSGKYKKVWFKKKF